MEFTTTVPATIHHNIVRDLTNDTRARLHDADDGAISLDEGLEVSVSSTPPANTLWVTVTRNPKDISAPDIQRKLQERISHVQAVAAAVHRGEPAPEPPKPAAPVDEEPAKALAGSRRK